MHVPLLLGLLGAEELVDVGGAAGGLEELLLVTGGGGVVVLVVVLVVFGDPGDVVETDGVVIGAAGAVPREGVAEQVLTWRPAVSDARPSGARGSEKPAGSDPT
jgi:hypothetical protein